MNISHWRDVCHGLLRSAVLVLPVLAAIGCSSAESGHAPGVAKGQSLTPGVTNFPIAYIKQPIPTTDIDVRDLITSISGQRSIRSTTGELRRRRNQRDRVDHEG